MLPAQLRKGNGFRKTCRQCGQVHLLKQTKCQCGYEFNINRAERRVKELEKKVEQGKRNRNHNNSSRIIAKAKDTLALFHGFGYEAVFLYCTNSSKRPETQLLFHDSPHSKAARFAKSSFGEKYRNIFAGSITQECDADEENKATQNNLVDKSAKQIPTSENQHNSVNEHEDDQMMGNVENAQAGSSTAEAYGTVADDRTMGNVENEQAGSANAEAYGTVSDSQIIEVAESEQAGSSNKDADTENYIIDIAEIEQETGISFATLENEDDAEGNEDEAEIPIEENESGLEIGMKMEAEDHANKLICCATILALKRGKVKVRYDGWGRKYDSWFDLSSGSVHPVGYCEEMEVPLCPPKDYEDIEGFTWHEYLEKSNSKPATSRQIRFEERKYQLRQKRGVGAVTKRKTTRKMKK